MDFSFQKAEVILWPIKFISSEVSREKNIKRSLIKGPWEMGGSLGTTVLAKILLFTLHRNWRSKKRKMLPLDNCLIHSM